MTRQWPKAELPRRVVTSGLFLAGLLGAGGVRAAHRVDPRTLPLKDDTMPFQTATSADGTRIAYETRGSGAPLILIGGAFNDRRSPSAGLPLAELLADAFQVIAYDRRARGDSGTGGTYAVEREIEDLRALTQIFEEPAVLFGHSSGASLALEAVADGLEARGLALFEPPYVMSQGADARGAAAAEELEQLIDQGRNGDAVAHFLKAIGMPEGRLAGMRQSPAWPGLEKLAPTLPFENAIVRRGGSALPPVARMKNIAAPVLALAGTGSPDWMRESAEALAAAARDGAYQEISGVDHAAPPEALAPPLRDFGARLG